MPGDPAPAGAPRPRFAKRVLRYPAHVILSAGMSLAVMMAERRIRKALRGNAGSSGR